MQYLPEYKLFILRKLLFKTPESGYDIPNHLTYGTKNHIAPNWKTTYKFITELEEAGVLRIKSAKIASDYPAKMKGKGFKAEETNYFGLGKKICDKIEKGIDLIPWDIIKIDLLSNDFSKFIFPRLFFFFFSDGSYENILRKYLLEYLSEFWEDKLSSVNIGTSLIVSEQYFNFKKNSDALKQYLVKYSEEFSPNNISFSAEDIAKKNVDLFLSDEGREIAKFLKSFRFIDTLLAFEYQKIIDIKNIFGSGVAIVDYKDDKEKKGSKITKVSIPEGKYFNWHCVVCGQSMRETENSDELNNWLREYSSKNPLACKKRSKHKNWLVARENKIFFAGYTGLEDSNVFRKKIDK